MLRHMGVAKQRPGDQNTTIAGTALAHASAAPRAAAGRVSCSLDAHAAEPASAARLAGAAWPCHAIAPVQISDHVQQLGTAGITTLLFKTEAGAVLIDGGMPQAALVILDHRSRSAWRPAT